MKWILQVALGLWISAVTFADGHPLLACAWIYETSVEGKALRANPGHFDFTRFTNNIAPLTDWEEEAKTYQAAAEKGNDLARSNYAVALMHLGRSSEALGILEELARKMPDEYAIAANLGTAYELTGQNEKAHQWIKRGMELNPESHYGTEWLHLKILEAKIALEKDPQWLQINSVLGYTFGTNQKPDLPPQLTDKPEREKVIKALEYQLHERMQFVKPPDPVVADLLFDLANIMIFHTTLETTRRFYDFAQTYGPLRQDLIAARKTFIEKQIKRAAPRRIFARYLPGSLTPLALGSLVLLLILLPYSILVRKRRQQ